MNMATSNLVDCFIHNCIHSTYLLQVSRFDCQDPMKLNQFQLSTLAITLNTYLSNPDSPTKRTKPLFVRNPYQKPPGDNKPYRPNTPTSNPFPYNKRINQVLTDIDEAPSSPPALDLDTYTDHIVAQLQTGSSDPSTRPCLLCREPHQFSACPLLQDEEFKSTFIIKLLACVSRELRNGKNRTGSHDTAKRIQQVLTDVIDTSTASDAADTTADSSLFLKGRD
jgi:hypothetical protein